MQNELTLSDREFERIKARAYRVAGISLSDAKRTLVVSRLYKLVRRLDLPSFDAYVDRLEQAGSAEDAQDFVNALTTNLTRFYREEHHFEHLKQHVATLLDSRPRRGTAGRGRLRIWSAGCSTGQEPYTIAMTLLRAFPELKRWDFRILATDIDTSVIARAALGVYPAADLAGLSAERAEQFERLGKDTVRVPLAVRERVAFLPLNLMDPWPMKGPVDAIFCRNVTIYFDKPTQAALFTRFATMLAPGGFLYIGHSENMPAASSGYRLVGKTIYQPVSPQRARHAA
jgi:chemotaxis protein methyltransferase CheR